MEHEEKEFKFLGLTGVYWFLAFPSLLGFVLFCLGFIVVSYKDALFGVGGTIFGSSLGTVFGLIAGARLQRQVVDVQKSLEHLFLSHRTNSIELQKQISDTLSKAVRFPWSSDESALKEQRKVLHWYYRTRKGEEEFWRYVPLDFSKQFEPGRLYCQSTVTMEGEEFCYEYEGFLIGNRLVLTIKPLTSREEEGIATIFHYGTKLGIEGYGGFYLHWDWNRDDGVDPCILADKPFEGTEISGRQSLGFGGELTKRWHALVPKVGMKTC